MWPGKGEDRCTIQDLPPATIRGVRPVDLVSANRAAREVAFLWGSQLAAAGAAFVTQLLLARGLPVQQYGALATALASVNLLAPLAGFGVGQYWLRVFGKEGWAGQRWVWPTLKLAIISSSLIMAIALVWAWSGVFSKITRVLMTLLIAIVLEQAARNVGGAIFQLEAHYLALAVYNFLPHGLRLLVAALAFWVGWSVAGVATGYALASMLIVILYSRVLGQMVLGRLALQGHGARDNSIKAMGPKPVPSLLASLQGAWPFALSGLFYLIYFQSAIALLGILVGEEAAGIYNVAFSIMSVIYLFPSVVYQQYLMPHLHRWAEHDQDRFLRVYRFGGSVMLIVSLAFMGLVAGLAPWIVPRLFGEAYHKAGELLAYLSLCIPLRFLATNVGSVLVTGENMRRKVGYQSITAVLNVVLNLALMPRWGILGAAAVTVFTEFFILAIYIWGVMRHVFGRAALSVAGPLPLRLSVLVWMGGVAFVAARTNSVTIMARLAVGALATAIILGLRYIRPRFSAEFGGR